MNIDPATPLPPPLPASTATPIDGVFSAVDALLRDPQRVIAECMHGHAQRVTRALISITVVCTLVYGAIMGSFSSGTQLWAAPVKLCLAILFSGFITLPSLYIFACLGGARARLLETVGLLAGLLALLSLLLIGFAPVALVFSRSIESLAGMGALHLLFATVAVAFGARFLHAAFRALGMKTMIGLNVWICLFVVVALQMTTALRPLIGTSPQLLTNQKKFFTLHWSDCLAANAGPQAGSAQAR